MPITRLSAWVALRCKEPLFWKFLKVQNEASAAHQVRTLCQVTSRAEFDRDPGAKARLDQIIRHPFIEFAQEYQCSTSTKP